MSLRVIVYDDAVTSAVVILNLIQDPVFVKKLPRGFASCNDAINEEF